MSKEFIEKKFNSNSINLATRQEKQLSYVLSSKIQDDTLNSEYLKAWAERKFQTNDYFLNWVKMIFKTENFLSFFKFLRYPIASTKIVRNKIEPQLSRVFNAEDSDFKYNVRGKDLADFIDDLDLKEFQAELFQRMLYKHNSIVISGLDPEIPNTPTRFFVDIDDVVSILEKDNKIWRIAFRATIMLDGEFESGTFYLDDERYSFYDKDNVLIKDEEHDLGHTPAHFIVPGRFDGDFIVRESIYTYIREEIEEYNFLKTLQKMTELNGAIPVVTKIETEDDEDRGQEGSQGQPDVNEMMSSQKAGIQSENESLGAGDLQPGTIHEIPVDAIKDNDGKINMDAVRDFINFHHIPVAVLKYLNERVNELSRSIVSTVVGDVTESNEEAKNREQIAKGVAVLESTLTGIAEELNRIRKLSDFDMLALKYGKDNILDVFIHYGTDFFLDSTAALLDELENAPNSMERKNIIIRINRNRYKNNEHQVSRQILLYDLMPYVSDVDFEKAIEMQIVSDINKEYQLRFTYWVDQFEAFYGDIVSFFKEMEGSKAEKLVVINNLMIALIKKGSVRSEE